MPEACATQGDGAACQNAAIYYLDQARASLDQPPYSLPADFTSLSPIDRDLILTDLDRVQYGLPAIPGLTAGLDADAANGVAVDDDPHASDPDFPDWGSNWDGPVENMDVAYEAWMYWDGLGHNLDCTSTNMSGCWGHRHNILWSFGGTGALAMGAAAGPDSSGQEGYTMILGRGDNSYTPDYTYTWQQAQADGAGTHAYSAEAPQMTVDVEIYGSAGTVTDSHGQSCASGTCSFLEPLNEPVMFTETPASGTSFDAWYGACTGTASCAVTPNQSVTWLAADFLPTQVGGVSGSGGAGSGGGGPGSGGSGSASGGKTGSPWVVRPRIVSVTVSGTTIRAKLSGSRLVCELTRRVGARWEHPRMSKCASSITYRHLSAGRYRLTVVSGTEAVIRNISVPRRHRGDQRR